MKAITVLPHTPGSASVDDIPEPDLRDGSVLVETIAVGVCGTDVEIVEGKYGWAPPGAPKQRHRRKRLLAAGQVAPSLVERPSELT